MHRSTSFPVHRLLWSLACAAAVTFLLCGTAHAAGSGMPWEQPLQQILDSVQGPVAKIVAVIIIIITGLTLAFGETSGGFAWAHPDRVRAQHCLRGKLVLPQLLLVWRRGAGLMSTSGADHVPGFIALDKTEATRTLTRLRRQWFSTHVGDVGHMLMVGPTGAGKSVLLALLALQFRRYTGSQVTIFDKGSSARAAVLAMGGEHHGLGSDGSLAFQPLARHRRSAERSWAAEWIAALLAHEKVVVTPEVKESVWSALTSLATAPAEERTLTGLSVLLQSNALKAALMPYTLDGPFGRLLDAAENRLELADVQCFETEELMHEAGVVLPVLTYLFHRLEDRFDGRPTLLILDEAWVYLDNPVFAARIREWLKVLRKKNVAVVFATQSLADIAGSSIAPAIIESCPQRIFLPNDRAIEPQARSAYERFGLNDRQIELIAQATPKRHYYLQSRRGNRLFELGLGPIALALCGASSPADQTLIDRVLAEHGSDRFAAAFLEANGLDWAAALLERFPQPCTGENIMIRRTLAVALVATSLSALPVAGLVRPAAAITVFDPSNFAQNILQAARALEQINNQIQSLQNEATMLQNMAKNLQRLDYSSLGQITGALQRIDGLMIQAEGIAFEVGATDAAFRQQFPEQYDAAVTTDQFVADARTRWRNSMSALPPDHADTGAGGRERPGRWRHLVGTGDGLAGRGRESAGAAGHQPAARPFHQAAAPDPEPDGRAVPLGSAGPGAQGAGGGSRPRGDRPVPGFGAGLHAALAAGRQEETRHGRPQRHRPLHGDLHPLHR